MADKMTQAEKMAKAREAAMGMANLPEDKFQIGVAEYAVETPFGFVKVKFTATKGEFDPAEAEAEFRFDQEQKRVAAEKRKAEAEAKKAINLAKKEREKRAKA